MSKVKVTESCKVVQGMLIVLKFNLKNTGKHRMILSNSDIINFMFLKYHFSGYLRTGEEGGRIKKGSQMAIAVVIMKKMAALSSMVVSGILRSRFEAFISSLPLVHCCSSQSLCKKARKRCKKTYRMKRKFTLFTDDKKKSMCENLKECRKKLLGWISRFSKFVEYGVVI